MALETTKVAVCDTHPDQTLVIPREITGNGKILKYVKSKGWAVLDIGDVQKWFSPLAVSEQFASLQLTSTAPSDDLAEFEDDEDETDDLEELEAA